MIPKGRRTTPFFIVIEWSSPESLLYWIAMRNSLENMLRKSYLFRKFIYFLNSDWLVFLANLAKLTTKLIWLGETLLSDPREFLQTLLSFHINGWFIVRDVKQVSPAAFSILTAAHLGEE